MQKLVKNPLTGCRRLNSRSNFDENVITNDTLDYRRYVSLCEL